MFCFVCCHCCCCFGCITQLAGSQFPEQGLNPAQQWKRWALTTGPSWNSLNSNYWMVWIGSQEQRAGMHSVLFRGLPFPGATGGELFMGIFGVWTSLTRVTRKSPLAATHPSQGSLDLQVASSVAFYFRGYYVPRANFCSLVLETRINDTWPV